MMNQIMKITKMFCSYRSYMKQEMNRIQCEDHNIGSYRLNNFFYLFMMIINIY